MTWFGKHCDATRRAVYRWCTEGSDRGEHMRILRLLEAMPAGTPWARDPALLEAELPKDFPVRQSLRSAGFKSQADVYHATDDDLMSVTNVGPQVLERIRNWWSPSPNGDAENP